ncbi:hypothetical protein D3C81_1031920 [compost metagenome]
MNILDDQGGFGDQRIFKLAEQLDADLFLHLRIRLRQHHGKLRIAALGVFTTILVEHEIGAFGIPGDKHRDLRHHIVNILINAVAITGKGIFLNTQILIRGDLDRLLQSGG